LEIVSARMRRERHSKNVSFRSQAEVCFFVVQLGFIAKLRCGSSAKLSGSAWPSGSACLAQLVVQLGFITKPLEADSEVWFLSQAEVLLFVARPCCHSKCHIEP
jgi:hypothetical protein